MFTPIFSFVVGLAIGEPTSLKPPLKILSGRALEDTFRGVVVVDVDGPSATAERFYPDGAYSKRTRGLRQGRFRVQGAELCVSLEPDHHVNCRRYARDARGQIYLVRFRDGESEPWNGAAHIRILPLSSLPE